MSLMNNDAFDAGLDDMLADMRENTAERGETLHANPGQAVRAVEEGRVETAAAAEAWQEQLERDEVADIRNVEVEPDGGYLVERADGRLEQFESGEGPLWQEALEQSFAQTNDIYTTAEQIQSWFDESPYESWAEVAEEFPEAYEDASRIFAAVEQLATVEAQERLAAEDEERLTSAIVEAADDEYSPDLPTAIAKQAQARAERAFVAQHLDPEVGWGSDPSKWDEDAEYAQQLAAVGIDPNDADLVDQLYPYIEQHDGDVAAAVAAYNSTFSTELIGELEAWEIHPDSEAAQQVANDIAQHGGSVEDSLRRLYPEYPGWSE